VAVRAAEGLLRKDTPELLHIDPKVAEFQSPSKMDQMEPLSQTKTS